MSKEIKTKYDLIINSTKIGPKYDKNYHNRYYHERRRLKQGRTKESKTYSKRWVTKTYNLFDLTRHTKDYLESKTLCDFYIDHNITFTDDDIINVLREYTNKKPRLEPFDGSVFTNDEREKITYDLYETLKLLVLDD